MKTFAEEELIQHVRQWLRDTQTAVPIDITDETDLIGSGILDSMSFIELMLFVETTTGEKIDLSDVDPSEFTTVKGLCQTMLRQQCRIPLAVETQETP